VKAVLVSIILVCIAGYYYHDRYGDKPALVIDEPVWGEVRMSVEAANREIEAVLFIRASSESDCRGRAKVSWEEAFEECEDCKLQEPKCHASLSPRYAKLFDDVPIPSAYLSATANSHFERDGRLVVYGLTDEEGVFICKMMKKELDKKYRGETKCIAPSGG
jgi:hypothetical protein